MDKEEIKMCNCETNNARLIAISQELDAFLNELERAMDSKLESDRVIEHNTNEMDDLKSNFSLIVANQKNADGKNQYSNDESRKAALAMILKGNDAYAKHKELLQAAVIQSEDSKLKIDKLKGRIKNRELTLEILKMIK
jgi:hypothetical protein